MDPDEKIEADLLAEEMTGQPQPAGTTAEGIAQMEQRISYLEARVARFQARLNDAANDPNLTRELQAALNEDEADLRTARQRLADYRAQQSARN